MRRTCLQVQSRPRFNTADLGTKFHPRRHFDEWACSCFTARMGHRTEGHRTVRRNIDASLTNYSTAKSEELPSDDISFVLRVGLLGLPVDHLLPSVCSWVDAGLHECQRM